MKFKDKSLLNKLVKGIKYKFNLYDYYDEMQFNILQRHGNLFFSYCTPSDIWDLLCGLHPKFHIKNRDILAGRFKLSEIFRPFQGHHEKWTLKSAGSMFVTAAILEYSPKVVIEIGCGYNTYFDRITRLLGIKLVTVDKTYYTRTQFFFSKLFRSRKVKHYDAYMGEYCEGLETERAQMIVSVSAIEHVPLEAIEDLYNDMYRVLEPGGMIVHSLDVEDNLMDTLPEIHLQALKKAGFLVEKTQSKFMAKGGFDKASATELPYYVKAPYRLGNNRIDNPAKSFPIGTILIKARKQ